MWPVRRADNLITFMCRQSWNLGASTSWNTQCLSGSVMGLLYLWMQGTWWRSWLRHWATSRKVAGSIPDVVIGIFHWHNPSGRTMALGSTQPLTEMSNRNISWWVKVAGAQGWQPYHLHVPILLKSGSLKLQEPTGPVQAGNGIALPIAFYLLKLLGLKSTSHL